jgi:hypothetical protein
MDDGNSGCFCSANFQSFFNSMEMKLAAGCDVNIIKVDNQPSVGRCNFLLVLIL